MQDLCFGILNSIQVQEELVNTCTITMEMVLQVDDGTIALLLDSFFDRQTGSTSIGHFLRLTFSLS